MVRELLLITTHLCSCSTSFLQLQMETTGTDNKAADLLAWLDHQNETDVMQSVLQQLQVEGPLHTAAAAPVRFHVTSSAHCVLPCFTEDPRPNNI